ncbi:hypothetical protein GCM10017674_35240 [Streptomyces gardneri]|uniref:Uncharacterized protein n=1 Tax=Streptomyces gardneri TaxID=66892 RepID=A0A4Y3RLI3_9ACTN|nr:hypothetical protein SGA01_33930 [Streptomyces gardneri]GHH00200.1 hypothetical protein GCM10017674_35240 [Streptomyces gardneri]
MVAFWRCVPASPPEESGGAVAAVSGSSAVAVSHRSTGYQGISDIGRPLPATRGSRVFTDGYGRVGRDPSGGVIDVVTGLFTRSEQLRYPRDHRVTRVRRILLGHSPPSRPAIGNTPPARPDRELVDEPLTADTSRPG